MTPPRTRVGFGGSRPGGIPARRRLGARFGAALGVSVLVALCAGAGATSAADGPADPYVTESALTKQGTGRFEDLSVTVGKTKHLGNEAVKVSWTWQGENPGAHQTVSRTSWDYNYMTVFQCWGDDADGPKREQCQYGASYFSEIVKRPPYSRDPDIGFALSRAVSPVTVLGETIPESTDPLEASQPGGYPASPGPNGAGIVPLHASPTKDFPTGEVRTSLDPSVYFDVYGTNEVALARTNGDGRGSVFFEAQTTFESQFLGCGARLTAPGATTVTGRKCWLVVVPRDHVDSNGEDVTTRASGSDRLLFSSPLSLSNWANRIVFPLDFDPVREPCRLGGVERPVVGHESIGLAMSSWQGPLCSAGQGYFFATTTDDIARATAMSDLPKLDVVTDPLAPAAIPQERGAAVHAPLAVSGITISLFIEKEYNSASAPGLLDHNGSRVEQLKLNQRLVAKLLTESYRHSNVVIDDGPEHLHGNPLSLVDDPEFKALNETGDLARNVNDIKNARADLARLFVTADASDAVHNLWQWVLSDADARNFLDGKADPFGMTVNRYYKGLSRYQADGVVRADIPKLEESCYEYDFGDHGKQKYCALDAAPYVSSFEQAAALTSRGQPGGVGGFALDFNMGLVKGVKNEPQMVGTRALLALTDTSQAARRGLVSAALRNADGRYVSPSTDAMAAAVAQAKATTTTGVSRVDPADVKGTGYPLTRFSYAVTNPALLDAAARQDYAQFLEVVTTTGQQPGTAPGMLPEGYAPLPKSYRDQAASAARTIRTAKDLPKPSTPPVPPPVVPEPPTPTPPPVMDPPVDTPPNVAGPDGPAAPPAQPPIVPGATPPIVPQVPAGPVSFTGRVVDALSPLLLPVIAGLGLLAGAGGRAMVWQARRESGLPVTAALAAAQTPGRHARTGRVGALSALNHSSRETPASKEPL